MSLDDRIVIVGGGTAGLSVAARLRRKGATAVTVIEPADVHYYQPLWTLVGAGRAPMRASVRPMATVMPKGVEWVHDAVEAIDPEAGAVALRSGGRVPYDALVVAAGIQLDLDRLPGLNEGIARGGVSTNYRADLAPRTWKLLQGFAGGTAVFTMPSTPIKCGGAPQKIAYLAADYWERKGLRDATRIVLSIPNPAIFQVPEFARVLDQVAARYGIEVRLDTEVVEIDPEAREVLLVDKTTDAKERIGYDVVHATPPQSAPDFLKGGPLAAAGDPLGWVAVDKDTLRHTVYPNVWALGDASNVPTSKTGAAARKQAPVVVEQLLASLRGATSSKTYDGYTSCPLVTSHNRMLLAEFDYDKRPTPSIPLIDLQKERWDMYQLKRWGLPLMYWHGMLKGYV